MYTAYYFRAPCLISFVMAFCSICCRFISIFYRYFVLYSTLLVLPICSNFSYTYSCFLYKTYICLLVFATNPNCMCALLQKKNGRDNSAVLLCFSKATAFHVCFILYRYRQQSLIYYLSSKSFSPCRCQNNLSKTFNCCAMAITTPFISILSVNHGRRMYKYAQKDVSTGVSVVKN